MFIFGHAGITIGAAMLIDTITHGLLQKKQANNTKSGGIEKGDFPVAQGKMGIIPIKEWLDYRVLLVASLLPDIIDKPVGQVLFRDSISYGRIYAHTFIFALVIGALGVWQFRRQGKGWLLIASFGSLMHYMEDELWRWPQVLWWPLWGWSFPREDLNGWLPGLFRALITEPDAFIPELVGMGILGLVAVEVFRHKRFLYTLKSGHIY